MLATVHEITEKAVGERRMAALRDLGRRTTEGKTAEEACAIAAETLASHARDVPFALLYLIDADGKEARLAGAAGVAMGEVVSPLTVDLSGHAEQPPGWPLAEAMRKVLESDQAIDLLLTDVIMPNGISGIELAQSARRPRQDLKVVCISGFRGAQGTESSTADGWTFLAKPFRQSELAHIVASALLGRSVGGETTSGLTRTADRLIFSRRILPTVGFSCDGLIGMLAMQIPLLSAEG